MGGSRFVRPETTTITLANGDRLTVKRRLNTGEQRAAFRRAYRVGDDGTVERRPLEWGMALVTAYLVDWSLTYEDGTPIAILHQAIETIEAAIEGLDYASFLEIKDAIEAHDDAVRVAREDEKKTSEPSPNAGATL